VVQFDRSAFISKFREEAGEHLQKLNEGIIALEGDPHDEELVNELMRSAHTLKGSSNMVGLVDISEVAHRMEDAMVLIRDGKLEFSSRLSDPFFEALDTILYMADQAVKGEPAEVDLPGLLGRMDEVIGQSEEKAPEPPAAAVEAAAEEPAEEEQPAAEKPEPPAAAGKKPTASKPAAARVAEPAGVEKGAAKSAAAAGTIRVRTEQVDKILNLIGEIVIAQIKAEDRELKIREAVGLAGELVDAWMSVKGDVTAATEGEYSADVTATDDRVRALRDAVRSFATDYGDDTARLSSVTNDLQEAGMRMRMLPVATVFNAFPRAVHDMAKTFCKEIALEIEGADTELDKKVLEEINDPLVHLVRNSVDHGIEPPEEREKAGKPRQGTIKLRARQEGDQIQVIIEDDGAGIDPAKVREAAVKKGFLTDVEARAMTDQEAVYLIFETGFSTSQIITEISGRGVGLDVVRQFISEKLKGAIDVASEVGKGTTMTLTLPLTLAIIRALMVKSGGQTFAVPTTSVEETQKVATDDIRKVEGREAIRLRGQSLPLIQLDQVLGLGKTERNGRDLPIVICSTTGQRMGFIVDDLMGEQQIVIKNLGTHLRQVDNVAGATILGAGEVVLILHVPDLVQSARALTGVRAPGGRLEEREVKEGPRRLLIVEDSFTTRELERSIFEASGYEVETANDGVQALAKLREGPVDLVVTDVQMPNMDGFELTRQVKEDASLSSIPVVIVTSLEREEEKRKGIEAGADAYITKSVFNQDMLLETVERLTG
jgi:two-component system, chemotaxis family, sensor kinase CheA